MISEYDTYTKDKVKVSYSLYAMLFDLGLSPSNKGTIYIKEIIEFIIKNNLYDENYNNILKKFVENNNYQEKNIKLNIRNTLRGIDFYRTEKNFKNILNTEYDEYYIVPSKLLNLIALIYESKVI